jgi:hypothetical protein
MMNRFVIAVILSCSILFAEFLPVVNSSFENPALGEQAYVYDVADHLSDYGWSEDTADRTWMIYNPKTYGTWDPVQPSDGLNWMQLTRAGSTMQISQIIGGYQIQADTVYKVEFDVSQRANWGDDAIVYSTLYSAKNGAQNRTSGYTLYQTGVMAVVKDNNWTTVSYEWDSTGSPLVGQNFDLVIGGKAIIDNVRIEAVPEPASVLILGFGLFCSKFRRRK